MSRRGDLTYVATCPIKEAPLIETSKSYMDIPIKPTGYVDYSSRVFKTHSGINPGSDYHPVVVKAKEACIALDQI